jgi:hypothetical protein
MSESASESRVPTGKFSLRFEGITVSRAIISAFL